jgi:[ribosomal protein S18]-alanine N-acetyltransferase
MLQIREALRRDLAAILEIERLAFPVPWSFGSFERELTLPFSRITVATLGVQDAGDVIGFLCRWLVADECHILNVAVHPDFRRRGVGAYLLNAALLEAAQRHAMLVSLEVRRTNVAARALYRKFRFEERRLRRGYYGPGDDAIVMELRLAAQGR